MSKNLECRTEETVLGSNFRKGASHILNSILKFVIVDVLDADPTLIGGSDAPLKLTNVKNMQKKAKKRVSKTPSPLASAVKDQKLSQENNIQADEKISANILGLNPCTFAYLVILLIISIVLIMAVMHFYNSRKPENRRKMRWYELNIRENNKSWFPAYVFCFWIFVIACVGYMNFHFIMSTLATAFFSLSAFSMITIFIFLISGILFILKLTPRAASMAFLNIPNLIIGIALAGNILFNWYEVNLVIEILIFCFTVCCAFYSLATVTETTSPMSRFFDNIKVILSFIFALTIFQSCQFYIVISFYKHFIVGANELNTYPLFLFFILIFLFMINQKILSVLAGYYYGCSMMASISNFKTMLNHVFYVFGRVVLMSFFEALLGSFVIYLSLGKEQNPSVSSILGYFNIPCLSFIFMLIYFIATNLIDANIIYVTRALNAPTKYKNGWNLKFMWRLLPTLGFILAASLLFSSFPIINSYESCLNSILTNSFSASGIQNLFKLFFTGNINIISLLSYPNIAKDCTALLIPFLILFSFSLNLFTTLKGFVIASFFFNKQ